LAVEPFSECSELVEGRGEGREKEEKVEVGKFATGRREFGIGWSTE